MPFPALRLNEWLQVGTGDVPPGVVWGLLNLQADAGWRNLCVLGLGRSGEREEGPITCPASESLAGV